MWSVKAWEERVKACLESVKWESLRGECESRFGECEVWKPVWRVQCVKACLKILKVSISHDVGVLGKGFLWYQMMSYTFVWGFDKHRVNKFKLRSTVFAVEKVWGKLDKTLWKLTWNPSSLGDDRLASCLWTFTVIFEQPLCLDPMLSESGTLPVNPLCSLVTDC